MKAMFALLLGGWCVVALACAGGASKSASSAPVAMPGSTSHDGTHARIAELDQEIDAELAKLELKRPDVPPNACVQPPCGAEPLAAPPNPTAAATCRPGPSDRCKDSCKLSDSICENAAKICELATLLGGNDAYANGKCASGKASCDVAGQSCCSCQL